MIQPGEKLNPNFELEIVKDGTVEKVSFASLLTQPTVVSVYMKNNTSSCDKQTVSLEKEAKWFEKQGIQLIALSKDTCNSHKKYADKHGLSYVLASDPDSLFSKATGSIVEKSMYGKSYMAPSRSAFYIDTDGTVLGVIEKITPSEHAEEVKTLVEQASQR